MDNATIRGHLKPRDPEQPPGSPGRQSHRSRNSQRSGGARSGRQGGTGLHSLPEDDYQDYNHEARSAHSYNPSFIQPTIISYADDEHAGGPRASQMYPEDEGSYRLGGSEQGSSPRPESYVLTPASGIPSASDTAPPLHHQLSFKAELEHLASMFMMKPRKNQMWRPDGPKDYARSVSKWKIEPTQYTAMFCHDNCIFRRAMSELTGPPGVRSLAASASAGTKLDAIDIQNDLEYVVPVTVGGQTVHLDFDTGSADLWVWSVFLQTTRANLKGHGIYDPRRSRTARPVPGSTWNITYGDGSGANGQVYTDVLKFNQITVQNQAIEVATHLEAAFLTEHGSDGLLGLAFPQLNTIKPHRQKTPMEHLIEQNLVKSPLFTVHLDKYGDAEKSFYTFGYIDHSALPVGSHITYVDVNSANGFWEFPSPSIQVGRHTAHRHPNNTAIADTGTTLILLDDSALDEIYGRIHGAKMDNTGWLLPTSSRPDNVSFAVGQSFFTISGEDLKFADAGKGMSFGAIQSRGQNKQDIFGDVFLKRVYAVFDQTPGHPRLGLGQRSLTDHTLHPTSKRQSQRSGGSGSGSGSGRKR